MNFPGLQGRILAVQSTLHRIADDEGVTARAVVGPRAVVMHAPAEFGEHKEHHIVGSIVLFEIMRRRHGWLGHVWVHSRVWFASSPAWVSKLL